VQANKKHDVLFDDQIEIVDGQIKPFGREIELSTVDLELLCDEIKRG
jgi:hypothetical protein